MRQLGGHITAALDFVISANDTCVDLGPCIPVVAGRSQGTASLARGSYWVH